MPGAGLHFAFGPETRHLESAIVCDTERRVPPRRHAPKHRHPQPFGDRCVCPHTAVLPLPVLPSSLPRENRRHSHQPADEEAAAARVRVAE